MLAAQLGQYNLRSCHIKIQTELTIQQITTCFAKQGQGFISTYSVVAPTMTGLQTCSIYII